MGDVEHQGGDTERKVVFDLSDWLSSENDSAAKLPYACHIDEFVNKGVCSHLLKEVGISICTAKEALQHDVDVLIGTTSCGEEMSKKGLVCRVCVVDADRVKDASTALDID